MTATVTIDKAGRIVVPKPMRDALHLKPGAMLEIEQEGNAISLRQSRPDTELVKKHGMWVVRHRQPLPSSVPDLIQEDREHRTQQLIRRTMRQQECE